jgi:methyltransferase (TIGR00027 family)
VNFFEIDHPATACLKDRGIKAMGRQKNLRLIAEDLGKRKLSDVLKTDKSWDLSAQTVIIAEGLVMYLSPEAVRDLFCQCAAFVGGGSRIAFSYIPAGEDGRPEAGRWTGLMLYLQKVAGEPWEWSIRPEELRLFLEETGWTIALDQVETARKHGVEFYAVATK